MRMECRHQNRTGGPCGAQHYQDGWCRWHHPDLEEQRQARSNKARARKQLAENAMSIGDVDALLCQALRRVHAGELEPGPANAMAGLAKAITAIRTVNEI